LCSKFFPKFLKLLGHIYTGKTVAPLLYLLNHSELSLEGQDVSTC